MRPISWNRFRTNSARPAYEANASNIDEGSIDCGIRALNWCNTPKCRQLATIKSFLVALIFAGIVQGMSEKFMFISIQQAALEHDYDPILVEWLIVAYGIVQGVLAIFIAHWGYRTHMISWLTGLLMLQAVAGVIAIIPTLTHSEGSVSETTIDKHKVDLFCTNQTSAALLLSDKISHSITTLIGLFVLQSAISIGFIAFITLGLIYLDDNSLEHDSPALIGSALASRFLGIQLGSVLSLVVNLSSFGWWFGWAILSPLLFIVATVISMFPRKLPLTLVRQAADKIVETATSSSQMSLSRSKFLSNVSFFSSIVRIFENKILLLNIFGLIFIETALINFTFQEDIYLRSRFLMGIDSSDLSNNEWTSRTLAKFIQPFGVALAILIGGLIIAKAAPSARKIVIWNFITAVIITLLFVSYIFIECKHNFVAGTYGKRLTMPFCSRSCVCDADIRFTPVCPENGVQTYFSPCHAGCKTEQGQLNGQRIYSDCSCGVDTEIVLSGENLARATDGACAYTNCQNIWIIFHALTGFAAVCYGSRVVGKIILSIRSALTQDKSMALGVQLALIALLAYLPGKIAYDYIASLTCHLWSRNGSICYLNDSHDYGNYVNILSAILTGIGALIEFVMIFFVKDLDLYGEEPDNKAVEMQTFSRSEAVPTRPAPTGPVEVEIIQPLLPTNSDQDVDTVDRPPVNVSTQPATEATPPQVPQEHFPSTSVGVLNPHYSSPKGAFVDRSFSSRFMSSTSTSSSTRYSPVYKEPENHVDELKTRFKSMNERVRISFVGDKPTSSHTVSDVNPSVGSDTEREPDVNIQQLESTVSSLSGTPSSTVHSPEAKRNRGETTKWHVEQRETDF